VIRDWFAEHYWLGYGIVTDELLVIDVDARHGGIETWQQLTNRPTRALLHTWQVRTGGGGLHVMFGTPPRSAAASWTLASISGALAATSSDLPACIRVASGTSGFSNVHRRCRADRATWWLLAVIRTRSYLGRPTSLQDCRKIAGTRLANGERTNGLLRIMGHVIGNGPTLDPDVLRELFLGWNRGMCDPPKADR
jgi:Bifunctional DNA primase/polymerase, N-terminal